MESREINNSQSYEQNIINFLIENNVDRSSVLDLMSGDELRHAMIFTKYFDKVTAHEFSENKWPIIKEMQKRENNKIHFLFGDIRNIEITEMYSVIAFCWPEMSIFDFFYSLDDDYILRLKKYCSQYFLFIFPDDKCTTDSFELQKLHWKLYTNGKIIIGSDFENRLKQIGFNIVKSKKYDWNKSWLPIELIKKNISELSENKEKLTEERKQIIKEINELLKKTDKVVTEAYRIVLAN